MTKINPKFEDFYTRVSERLGESNTLVGVSSWLTRYTKLDEKKFTFKNHEYQKDICDDTSPHLISQKPSQIGFTELTVRIALALLAIRKAFPVMYVLPSAEFAAEFAKTRFDPVIESSDRLSALLVKGANSATMKRLGTSFLYFGGAATKRQAISRPVKGLIIDEKDHCNQAVLTAYFSRLRHVLENEEPWVREFSTPTVEGYGINKDLERSTANRYKVKCKHCNTWIAPNFDTDVYIPGFSENYETFKSFTKEMLMNPDIKVNQAFIGCQKCHNELDSSLRDPSRRKWVKFRTQAQITGYEIKPYDLPMYNTTKRLIQTFALYDDAQDYWNFVQGEVFSSKSNQVLREVVKNNITLVNDLNNGLIPEGLCLGADVGAKQVYVMIGKKVEGHTKVFYRTILHSRDGDFKVQILNLFKKFKCYRGCIDIAPDFSLSRNLMEEMPGSIHAVNYVKDNRNSTKNFVLEEDGIIKLQRTKSFNSMVEDINSGRWQFSVQEDEMILLEHMQGMKRINQKDKEGESNQLWVKIGQDHYLHAAMYLDTAIKMEEEEYPITETSDSVPIGVNGIKMGSNSHSDLRTLATMMGVK